MALTVMSLANDRVDHFPTFRCQNNAWFLDSRYPSFIRIVITCIWKFAFNHRRFYIFVKSGHLLIDTQYGGFRFSYTYSRIFPQDVIQPLSVEIMFDFIYFLPWKVKSYMTQLQCIYTMKHFG